MKFKDFLIRELEGTQAGNFFYDFLNIKNDLREEDMTIQFLETMKEYALERVSANSAITYLSAFKTAFYKAERSGFNFSIDYDDVTKYLFVRPEASENISLTPTELKMLEMYTPLSAPERFTKNVFLLCAYTGCRVGDYPLITEANFHGNELQFTCFKTTRSARLPLHPLVPELISNLREFNYPMPSVPAIVGQNIKRIYDKLGVNDIVTLYRRGSRQTAPKYNFVSAHTARRSFATNCYLDGYSIKQISSMMGHTNTGQTERYIITSYSDDIKGEKTYLTPNKKESKADAVKRMILNLGISKDDADSILEKIAFAI